MSASIKVARANTMGRAMPGTGYRGDPGLFGFLGKAVKGIAGVASNFIPGGGIVRTAVKTASSILGRKGGKVQPYAPVRGPGPAPMTFAGQTMGALGLVGRGIKQDVPAPGIRAAVERFLPGGATGMQAEIGSPSGYHVNKSSYWLKSGEFIPKGTRWVRNRRRNPLNPRALDRAMGRIGSAKKAASKLGRITIRKASCA